MFAQVHDAKSSVAGRPRAYTLVTEFFSSRFVKTAAVKENTEEPESSAAELEYQALLQETLANVHGPLVWNEYIPHKVVPVIPQSSLLKVPVAVTSAPKAFVINLPLNSVVNLERPRRKRSTQVDAGKEN